MLEHLVEGGALVRLRAQHLPDQVHGLLRDGRPLGEEVGVGTDAPIRRAHVRGLEGGLPDEEGVQHHAEAPNVNFVGMPLRATERERGTKQTTASVYTYIRQNETDTVMFTHTHSTQTRSQRHRHDHTERLQTHHTLRLQTQTQTDTDYCTHMSRKMTDTQTMSNTHIHADTHTLLRQIDRHTQPQRLHTHTQRLHTHAVMATHIHTIQTTHTETTHRSLTHTHTRTHTARGCHP